ncbi:MAG TPA: hypothetical protein VEC99_06665, partial [Clostridia bacterium]|nr:hypothetical protein [Clostridia bacterium]
HGPVMKELGYTLIPATQSAEAAGIELAASAARLHRLYLEQLTRSGLLSEDCRRKAEEISQLKEQIQSLSEGLARQSKAMEPLTKNSWVRFGMAVGVVADVRTNNGH